jgi:TolB-like protein/thioredoxin-like negative regulator of GroEL
MLTEASRAVFLSYASQDAQDAQRVSEALRAAGIEVWFDQSELRGGDAWDLKIRQQIRDCALFIPIISAHTTARPEGYFRLEWSIADQRSQMIARNKAFIIPVCVDATPESVPDLPESFQRVHWTRVPGGATPAVFCQRIATLLGAAGPPAAASPTHSQPSPLTPPLASSAASSAPKGPHFSRWLLLAGVLLLLAGVVALRPWRRLAAKPATTAAAEFGSTTGPAAPGAAALLVAQAGVAAAPERSIAVLPFTDMSEKKDQEYFSDGLSEELIDLLTKVPDLRVPARTSSFYFKGQHATIAEIAKALGVAYVLEGSVRKAGNTVRVTAQLIRADNGYHLWSQTYDRDLKDVFKVQDEIAGRVVEELKLTLPTAANSSAARTENAAAHNLYLLGRKYEDQPTPESQKSAIETFDRAIALDPGYAAAYARVSLSEASLADLTGDRKGLDRASAAAERAITLAPDSADGYQARAQLRSTFLWDWDGANADYAKALAIDPNNSDALYGFSTLLATLGRLPEALAAIDKAIGIDPLVATYYSLRARLLNNSGDTEAARDAYHQLLSISPEHPHANVDLAIIDMRTGKAEQALAELQQPAAPGWRVYGSALIEHSLGHAQQSQQALDQFIATTAQFAAFQIAEIYAWRGQKDLAFQWLERAYTQHDGGLTEITSDPLLASLHGDPRYQAFMRKMNLAQ